MMARKKIIPPVTPRIVQARPRQQLLRYVLLACAFLLAVWLSYEYGNARAPADNDATAVVPQASTQRIRDLAQERDSLKLQVAELKQRLRQADRTTRTLQARIQAQATQQQPQAPQPERPPPASVDNTLSLDNVRIDQTASANTFRITFSVRHTDDSDGRVTGTLWIAVNGFVQGVPTRLSFKTLSPDRRLVVKMGFDRQQDVTEEIVLPVDFRPKNVLIEAKPYGEKYTGTTQKIDWITTE